MQKEKNKNCGLFKKLKKNRKLTFSTIERTMSKSEGSTQFVLSDNKISALISVPALWRGHPLHMYKLLNFEWRSKNFEDKLFL